MFFFECLILIVPFSKLFFHFFKTFLKLRNLFIWIWKFLLKIFHIGCELIQTLFGIFMISHLILKVLLLHLCFTFRCCQVTLKFLYIFFEFRFYLFPLQGFIFGFLNKLIVLLFSFLYFQRHFQNLGF